MLRIIALGVVSGLVGIVIFALVAIIGAIPMYFLWNWIMPTILGLKVITFWQAFGILWLSGLLFKSSPKA